MVGSVVLTLSDPDSGTTLELFNAQSLTDDRSAALDVSPPPGFDSDEPFLTSLEQGGTVPIQGAVTGPRLARNANYSSDPITALAEWAVTFEALVNGGQGDGYDLTRGYKTGDTFRGMIESATWVRRGGEPFELGYDLQFVRGQGANIAPPVSPDAVSPGGDYQLAGETIETLQELSVTKRQQVQAYRRTFAEDPSDNDLRADSGALREITVSGRVAGDASTRRAFEQSLQDSLGQDTLVDFRDAFTGRTYTGMIDAVAASDEATQGERLGEFDVAFVEGQNDGAGGPSRR